MVLTQALSTLLTQYLYPGNKHILPYTKYCYGPKGAIQEQHEDTFHCLKTAHSFCTQLAAQEFFVNSKPMVLKNYRNMFYSF